MPRPQPENDTDFRLGIKRARGALTQPELAERTGLSRSTIANLETTVRDPRFSTVVKVARGTGASLDHIADHEPADVATQVATLTQRLQSYESVLHDVVALSQNTERKIDELAADMHAAIRVAGIVVGARRQEPPAIDS